MQWKDSCAVNKEQLPLTIESLSQLKNLSTSLSLEKGDYVFQAGDIKNNIYYVLSGRVKLFRLSSTGREVMQWFCFPDEFFGLSEIQNQGAFNIYAQCCEPSEILVISKKQFIHFINNYPDMALCIIEQLSLRLNTVGDMLLNITADDAYIRLVKLLQRLGNQYGREYQGGVKIQIQLTHKELSNMLGTCRQTVTTLLGQLKKQELIEFVDRLIVIPSTVRLQELIDQAGMLDKECEQNKVKH